MTVIKIAVPQIFCKDDGMSFFDALETRTADQRLDENLAAMRVQVAQAKTLAGYQKSLSSVAADVILSLDDLAKLPILRKSDLSNAQKPGQTLGGYNARALSDFAHVFQSPGPIYEPGGVEHDWWRMGRFAHAAGVGKGDIVQNCFGYHLTPAGMIFESGARAVGAAVLPAGVGQTDLQIRAAVDIGTTAYAGTPDYLKVILDKAAEMG